MTTGTTHLKPSRSAKKTKASTVARMLLREKGATLDEIRKATGWQAHSCRAFLTSLRKKGSGLIREDRPGGKTAYRIDVSPAATEPAHSALAKAEDA